MFSHSTVYGLGRQAGSSRLPAATWQSHVAPARFCGDIGVSYQRRGVSTSSAADVFGIASSAAPNAWRCHGTALPHEQRMTPSIVTAATSTVAGAATACSASSDGGRLNTSVDAAAAVALLPATAANVPAAAAALRAGRVIAVPTDTLYGLAACANDSAAIRLVYHIKCRAPMKPVALCVAQPEDVAAYGVTDHLPGGLLAALLPGPVTLVLTKRPGAGIAAELNPGAPAVGIRVPDCDFVRQVCAAHGGAIALTSANVSGAASTVEVSEFSDLWSQLGGVFDAGRIRADSRAGSTIIDLTQPGAFAIQRRGVDCERVLQLLTARFALSQQQ